MRDHEASHADLLPIANLLQLASVQWLLADKVLVCMRSLLDWQSTAQCIQILSSDKLPKMLVVDVML